MRVHHCRQEVTALEMALEAAEKAAAAAEARAYEAEHSASAAQDALKACPCLAFSRYACCAHNSSNQHVSHVVLFPCG